METPIFSVGEFLDVVNIALGARSFIVQGEVVGARPHPTGMYFSLKDKDGTGIMDCYLSPHAYRGLGFPIEDGMEMKVGGVPSIYKAKGRFSFRVETIEIAGEGSLKKAYDALKKKLQEEGLFDRKRPLPEFIRRIGLITSKTGAVIDDFRRNLAPLGLTVLHRDVRVEGVQAADQIIRAVQAFDRASDVDVVVIIRGGGSMEDLQAFNHEHVVRAVFGSRVPTIVAIGHDRDVPLAQMVADGSASTPTATAHLINTSWDRLTGVSQTGQRLVYAFERALASVQSSLGQNLMHAVNAVGHGIERISQTIIAAERHMAAASPERLLRLGYSIVTDQTGAVIKSATQLRHGQEVTTRLAKGSFTAQIKEIDK